MDVFGNAKKLKLDVGTGIQQETVNTDSTVDKSAGQPDVEMTPENDPIEIGLNASTQAMVKSHSERDSDEIEADSNVTEDVRSVSMDWKP